MNIQELKQHLPRGWQKVIAEETGFSKQLISSVLNEKKHNIIIIEVALKLATDNKKKLEKINKKIQKVIQ
jgi:hypothetical protein